MNSSKIPPFVTIDTLKQAERKLSVICDVSADSTNPLTPGMYSGASDWKNPC